MNVGNQPKSEDNEVTPSSVTESVSPINATVTQGVAGDTPPPRSTPEADPSEEAGTTSTSGPTGIPMSPVQAVSPPATTVITAAPSTGPDHVLEPKIEYEEELLLKWDDHHKSFFEAAEDLCHQEQFIDVTLSCGEHNFPAHKLVLSVCSPYFRHLFLRNPCKHPIVVLKDVHFKYMKLLLMYMYRGEVSVPQEDLHGLLKTARGLQIRGLVELERKREAEGFLASANGSPIKRAPSDLQDGASTTSCDLDSRGGDDFSIDDVRSRLHGQLEIQPIVGGSHQALNSQPLRPPSNMPPWLSHAPPTGRTPPPAHTTTSSKLAFATSSSNDGTGTGSEGHHSDPDDPRHYRLPMKRGRETPNNGLDNHWADNNGRSEMHRGSPLAAVAAAAAVATSGPPPRSRSRPSSSSSASASNAALLAAAQAAGMPLSALDPSDPMSSMNALLAAAQAHSGSSSTTLPTTLASLLPPSSVSASATSTSSPSAASSSGMPLSGGPPPPTTTTGSNGPGVDLSQATAMANVSQLQLYYYMQKVAAAGMGNPKERKDCPICSKTLYDRSTWNRHMRIHTGEKPYPCRFCGRRFRTNYNKLGHEKKCPDRHSRTIGTAQPQPATGGQTENVVYR